MTNDLSPPAPRLAIVIPVFRHPGLVVDAIDAALAQQAGFAIRVVLVNDGCPYPETHEVCHDYARAHPDRISYLRKPNGGLSDARNHGIRYVLATFSTIEAIYLLDADNLLLPQAMANAMAELDAHPDADWIYPNIDMFGMAFHGDYGGDYSVLTHTAMNVSEAGSLIRRRVFEALLFDTDFKHGWEDWDFFLSAAELGFRGRNLEHFGFRYRKRPESMLADAERDQAVVRSVFGQKHRALMQAGALMELEHSEAPRYAILLTDTDEVIFTSDPADETERLTLDALAQRYWQARCAPTRFHFPGFVVAVTSATLAALQTAKLLHWAFWQLEDLADRHGASALGWRDRADERTGFRVSTRPAATGLDRAAAMMIGPERMARISRDFPPGRLANPSQGDPAPLGGPGDQAGFVELTVPGELIAEPPGGMPSIPQQMRLAIDALHTSGWSAASRYQWDWRKPDIQARRQSHRIQRAGIGGGPVFPMRAGGARNVGFVLPLVEFGGVEKVALNMARGLKAQGYTPHLVIADATEAAIGADWRAVFESISFLGEPGYATWGGGRQTYLGTEIPKWAQSTEHGRALGLMAWLDVVVTLNGGAIMGALGALRRHGVTSVSSLHLSDLSRHQRPQGNTYLSLAYEHAIDLIAPCSLSLGAWCRAMGVPAAKVVPVPNAPGFPLDQAVLQDGLKKRALRDPAAPLRVLYLGRLDAQKGLDRLSAVVSASAAMNLEWRLVGKAVIGQPDSGAGHLAGRMEPPVFDPAELAALYAWADVVVLLSSYEGLPLTILEAMRQGAVMIATDVGANSEVLRDGENGFLLALHDAVPLCLDALKTLADDRDLLRRLSGQAARDMQGRDWQSATHDLAQRLDQLRPARGAEPHRLPAATKCFMSTK